MKSHCQKDSQENLVAIKKVVIPYHNVDNTNVLNLFKQYVLEILLGIVDVITMTHIVSVLKLETLIPHSSNLLDSQIGVVLLVTMVENMVICQDVL